MDTRRHRVRNLAAASFLLFFGIALQQTLSNDTRGGVVTVFVLWTVAATTALIWLVTTDSLWSRSQSAARYLGGCLPSISYTPPRNRPIADLRSWLGGSVEAGGFFIVSAIYGTPDASVDVTARLNSMIAGPYLQFTADNETLGGDPAPNRRKVLRVTWQAGREVSSSSFDEGTSIRIP